MCGIAGFCGRFDPDVLGGMISCVAHRGPDGEGRRILEPGGERRRVGLAHRRLSIIDLSDDGAQPMGVTCDRCGSDARAGNPHAGLWLTYNGEIYNFPELRRDLESRGHRFHSRTDSEVLLHLYADEGPAMLERLNGIFALALYDGRPSGQRGGMRPGDVLVARDGLGVKPLYYAQVADGLLFGSEIKSLLATGLVSRDLDPAAIHYHLAYLWAPAPTTILSGVRKLRPGFALIVRDGAIEREWCHYDLPYGRERMGGTEEEVARDLAREVEAAVDRQMVADVPVGAFLSGGLDSSAVVAMMRRVRPDYRPRCYSIGFRGDGEVEGNPADLPYARRVAKHLDVDLCVLEIEADAIGHLERMLYQLDEPQADPAPINALLIAERARADGTKVLLSGAGGDDLFSGYRRHYALRMERAWSWLPGPVRGGLAAGARWAAEGGMGMMDRPAARRAAKAFAYADLDTDRRMASYFWWSGEAVRRELYTPAFAAATRHLDTAAPLVETLARIPGERDPLNRMLYLEAKHFLADHNLNYTDKTGMSAGVETRVPLLDRELIDFATRIPPEMKQRGRVGKSIFKKSMEPFLPHDVIYRPKTGFGAPLRGWLHGELRDMRDDTLSAASLSRRGWFEPAAVARLLERDRRGEVDAAYTIFSLMCIELWCRMFVDAPLPVRAAA
ncbi:asparagine synthase (glutamine-hydrolyzing) [Longimicrobium terrae]|uniref:asparagine synthase (glutamine-hydrolyzing) n=1 Tax=Longimicrobium terrae TaxID=1639882 RepID=A0A841GWG3_9BACT|nr:asparagine synthase (glutamine-hydrolyzing) [Longimicrobium terrae]MBB4634514.1 asparagine synthase (glutamine-hydrolyzing) [Longimicrobium terrae]MBB6068596.1 asparagine synthase (glutamine-hydrolyzing) [Longimicrobium terrae]NNC27783.1 asparagine synthase (glutamine-hydrolyzing) [Longimicrobium terrae]